MTPLVVLTSNEFCALIRDAVVEALEAQGDKPEAPASLGRAALARELGVSLATRNRIQLELGFPELVVGDSPRFDRAEVMAWLRARQQPTSTRGKRKRWPAIPRSRRINAT